MVSESKRLALHRAARAALGEEEGDTLMELSPPANTDIATRQDIERSEERVNANIRLAVADMRTYTWNVVIGTGVALYLATVGTVLGGMAFLLRALELS